MIDTTAPVMMMPQYGGNNDGWGCGGGAIWAIVLIALLGGAWGNRNNGYGDAHTDVDIFKAQMQGQILNESRATNNGLCDLGFTLNGAIKDASYQNLLAIKDGNALLSNGLCQATFELSRQIGDNTNQMNMQFANMNYKNLEGTNRIVQAIECGNQRILDRMCQDKTQALQEKLAAVNQLLSEQRIVAALSGCGCGCSCGNAA